MGLGTAALVSMRADLLRRVKDRPEFGLADADFAHLFASWFNRGFLELRRIDWSTPASVLERLIRYEAVHAIQGWEDLRRRIDPPDRRCFAFFHPNLPDEPLIFLEVALMREMPRAIPPILAADRPALPASEASVAVFYSISNCQSGLRGIAFGNMLIKQVVHQLRAELPGLLTMCTLSPVPGFRSWLAKDPAASADGQGLRSATTAALVKPATVDGLGGNALEQAIAQYLLLAKGQDGRPIDPVARFHLGNGARLERVNAAADPSQRALAQSAGAMVNYVYDAAAIERNRDAYARDGTVAASRRIRALAGQPAG